MLGNRCVHPFGVPDFHLDPSVVGSLDHTRPFLSRTAFFATRTPCRSADHLSNGGKLDSARPGSVGRAPRTAGRLLLLSDVEILADRESAGRRLDRGGNTADGASLPALGRPQPAQGQFS